MRRIFILLILFSCLGVDSFVYAADPMIQKLSQQARVLVREPEIQKSTLPGGIILYYIQDRELPILHLSTFTELGTIYDTEEERGLAEFFMSAWRAGGSQSMSSQQIDATLERVAATISAEASEKLSQLRLGALQKDAKVVLDIYFDLLRRPAFENERIEIIRKNILNGIQERNENTMDVAMREFEQSLYGQHSPHAWMSTPTTIAKFDQQRLKKYYEDTVSPSHMWMAATSPLTLTEFVAQLKPYLVGWDHSVPLRVYPTNIEKTWQASEEFIQKEGNQSAIVMGHFSERRFNPDKYKIILADDILGGSTFGSRLGDRIRTELGLAYGADSSFEFSTDYGAFVMVTRTKSESTIIAVNEMKRILSDMLTSRPITAEELALAKERTLNSLVFQYPTPFTAVMVRVQNDYNGYPPNYVVDYQKGIEAVTLEQVNEILPKYFFPDKLKVLVVGDRAKIPDFDKWSGVTQRPLDLE